jgi:septum formation protein
MRVKPFIYLASQSPRRSQLLAQLGVEHRLLLPDASEDSEALEVVLPGEAPLDYVQRVTALKLQAALARLQRLQWPVAPVLCADTTVALGRTILGKPQDATHADQMLKRLAGRSHRVMTAIAVGDGTRVMRDCSVSRVRFAPLSDGERAAYVASGEPMGKAGAYAVQGLAAAFIERIQGSYSGIMGLPLFETAQALRTLDFAE